MKKAVFPILLATASFLAVAPAWATSKDIDPLKTKNSVKPDMSLESCTAVIDQKRLYSLPDLIHIGLCNNNQTRASWAGFLAQRSRLGSQRGRYLPTVNATGDYTITETSVENFAGGSNNMAGAGLSLEYLLYDFGQREAQTEQVKQNLVEANFANSLTIQNVLYDIVRSYYDYFATQALLDASKESEEASRVSLEAASLRERVGRAPVVEKLQADAAYSQTKLTRVQAENNVQKAKGALLQVIGLNPIDHLNIETPDGDKIVDKRYVRSTKDIVTYAEKAHPDILSANARVESQKALLDAEKAKRLPSISTTADLTTNSVVSGKGIERDNGVFAVRVRFPLFTGFSRTYDIQTARHQVEQAEAELGQARDRVRLDVWNAYQDFNTAAQNISTTEALFASASEAEKAALARYKSGKGSLIDLLNAQTQSASARQQRVQAKYDWFVTKANLLRASGDIKPLQFEAGTGSSFREGR